MADFVDVTTAALNAAGSRRGEVTSLSDASGAKPTVFQFDATYPAAGGRVRALFLSETTADLELRILGDQIFAKTPKEARPGKPWIQIAVPPRDRMSLALSLLVVALEEETDPRLTWLGLSRVTVAGPAQLSGESVTRYAIEGTLTKDDLTKLNARWADTELENLSGNLLGAKTTGFVWVDSQGLVRKVESTRTITTPARVVKKTVLYSRFGESVAVDPPPASEVIAAADTPGASG